ncbi:HlyD family efflux transporter periplasmic adaptor subunit [Aquibacillus rhizosphaerae]|uniref:HlyD family efflux transporter periplasmic adaptor subunit n=1 Tax=Aquibacillus rhizosphaerae TaxID=3051431 RepID=A0ABT7KZG2_9BACI|nr:HlyD family efflux transporter periplasmic adaptor subunit [Aquibacillus sp. LR5S19]MDL4838917.1 HlyD family efflux transporter periplasmic adaptor subunit [Aquibacillus sp. LR5S19]
MREELKNLKDMSDSRELLEAKPNPIMPLFIYLLIIVVVISIVWTYFGEMDEVVKANGVVRTNETISSIRTEVPSKVESIEFTEGQQVNKDDILFTLDQSDQELQKQLLEEELTQVKNKKSQLNTLKQSIESGESLFDEQVQDDNEVYERYVSYQTSLSLYQQEFEDSTIEINQNIEEQSNQRKNFQSKKENSENKLEQLDRLKRAIENKENLFDNKGNPYFSRFATIELTIEQMEEDVEQSEKAYNSLKEQKQIEEEKEEELPVAKEPELDESLEQGINQETEQEVEQTIDTESSNSVIKQEQIEESKRLYEQAEYELEQYINQEILKVNNEIEQEKEKLNEITTALDGTSDYSEMMDSQEENYSATLENFKSDMLVQVSNDIDGLDQRVDKLNQKLTVLEEQIQDSIMVAPVDGVVHVRTNVSAGDFLEAGTEVLTIVPDSSASTFKVQLSVLNRDIANTRVGDIVNFRINSLPYQEYGLVKGEITKISSDATIDPESGRSYYLVEATMDQKKLFSHKGEEANIKVGMTTDAHIVTDSKKIIYYLLEKIDLRG